MGIIDVFEDMMRGIVQGPFRRVMGSKVQEQEILDTLRRTMDDHVRSERVVEDGRGDVARIAPSFYVVRLNPSDLTSLDEDAPSVKELVQLRAQVCRQMGWNEDLVKIDQLTRLGPRVAFALNAIASRQGYLLQHALRVTFQPDPSLARGRIEARVAAQPDSATPPQQPGVSGAGDGTRTMMAPQPDVAAAPLPRPQVGSIPPAWLTLLRPDRGQPFLLDRPIVTIGRGEANDIVINDARVSRAHAEIRFDHGAFSVHDLVSHNGVYINGARVSTSASLRDRDLISICGYEFVFQRR
ncbi:MAG TPA: FhaA domain-containing protein [Ktedonobacterales bacterium]